MEGEGQDPGALGLGEAAALGGGGESEICMARSLVAGVQAGVSAPGCRERWDSKLRVREQAPGLGPGEPEGMEGFVSSLLPAREMRSGSRGGGQQLCKLLHFRLRASPAHCSGLGRVGPESPGVEDRWV